jgi:hypothetical protein
MNTAHPTRPALPASRLTRFALTFAAGLGLGFMAGAWSSQAVIHDQCSTTGTAAAGEMVFDCANVRIRGVKFR